MPISNFLEVRKMLLDTSYSAGFFSSKSIADSIVNSYLLT